MRREWAWIGAVAAVKVLCAARWGLLADEAYHWTWSMRPALGYYDQPPLVGWLLWVARSLGDAPLALRAPSIALWLVAAASLTPFARDRAVWWAWAGFLPPLAVLTTLAVPDAGLLACWGLGLAGALRGGRGWVWAGVFGGLAALSKYTGAALLPLLVAAASPAERRTPWPWVGLAVSGALLLPNVGWNLAHELVTVRFVLSDGLATAPAPGLSGVVTQVRDQIGVVTPIAWGVGVWAAVRGARSADREDRLLAAASLPLWVAFAAAALGGRPEAHWPAPAWIGAGLLASRAAGAWPRIGVVTAGAALALGILHLERPVWTLAVDPAARFAEGEALAAIGDGPPLWAERYQEASLLWYARGEAVGTFPGCGRRSQFDLDRAPPPAELRFVRPARSGPPACLAAQCAEVRRLETIGPGPRGAGPWEVFLARGCAPTPR